MDGGSSEGDDTSLTERWTCEACGCNTNQQSDRSCTICGTSNSGKSDYCGKDDVMQMRRVRFMDLVVGQSLMLIQEAVTEQVLEHEQKELRVLNCHCSTSPNCKEAIAYLTCFVIQAFQS